MVKFCHAFLPILFQLNCLLSWQVSAASWLLLLLCLLGKFCESFWSMFNPTRKSFSSIGNLNYFNALTVAIAAVVVVEVLAIVVVVVAALTAQVLPAVEPIGRA